MTTVTRSPAAQESPYKGLLPYSEADAERFFGRDTERELIVSNLRARRLTLLYGESGVGKSSLLRAGVVRDLREQARSDRGDRGRARAVPVVFDAWRDDPVRALVSAIADQAEEFLPEDADSTLDPLRSTEPLHLDHAIELWCGRLDAKLLLILDQFEEYFLYHPAEDGEGTLVEELPRALMRSDIRANFLIAIREDALAKLDGFRSRIPDLMGNRLRIRHLDRKNARDAIEQPIEYYKRTTKDDMSIEPALVDAVLDQVEAGKVQLDGAGLGDAARGNGHVDGRIEAPYLQLVMERLWNVEMEAGSKALRLETLERLGGSQTIVRTHLDEVMSGFLSERQDAAADVFRYLVTRGGTKIAYSAGDLADLVGRSERDVQDVLHELDDVRILRTVDGADRTTARYEIFHDVLAAAVLDWRQRHDEGVRLERERSEKEAAERQAREAREAERRERMRAHKFKGLMIGAAVLFVLAAGAAVFALLESNEANREKEKQASAAIGRRAYDLIGKRPDVAMLAALEAYRLRETFEARSAVLAGLHRNPGLPALFVGHFRAVNAVAFSPNGSVLASGGSDGALRLWGVESGRPLAARVIAPDSTVDEIVFVDERTLATAADDGVVRLWDVSDPAKLVGRGLPVQAGTRPQCGEPDALKNCTIESLAVNRDGVLAVGREDGRIRFWRAGEQLERLPREGRVLRRQDQGNGGPWALAFSPDGLKLASAESPTTDKGSVSLWDVSRLSTAARLKASTVPHPGADSVAFRAGGRILAVGGDDGTVVLRKVTGRALGGGATLSGHLDAVYGLAFSADGSVLASAGNDNAVLVWDVARRLPFGGPRTHTDDVNGVTVSRDGRFVASASSDGLVKVWRIRGPSLATTLGNAFDVNWDVAIGAESTLVAVGDKVRHWNLADVRPGGLAKTDSQERPLPGKEVPGVTESMWSASFTGDLLAVTGSSVALGRFPRPGKLEEWSEKLEKPWSLNFAPGRRTLAVGSKEGELTLWNVANPRDPELRTEKPIKAHRGFIHDVLFNPDGTLLATAGADGMLRLWEVADSGLKRLAARIAHDRHAVVSLAFAPDGETLASGGRNQRIAFWDVSDVRNLRPLTELPFQQQTDTILSLAFSRDGKVLAAGDGDEDVVLWDVEGRQSLGTGDLAAHTNWESAADQASEPGLDSLAFDDQGFLISAGRHVPVVVWSPELWSDDYETLRANVCAIVRKPLTAAQWDELFGDTPFASEKPEACVQRQD